MGLKYADENVAVFLGWFRGLRVRDLRNGRVLKPSIPVMAGTLHAWTDMRMIKFSSRRARELAEAKIFRDCGYATLDPDSLKAFDLSTRPRDMLKLDYFRHGEMAALSEADGHRDV